MLTENESNLLTKNESDTLITDTDNTEQIQTLEKERESTRFGFVRDNKSKTRTRRSKKYYYATR